MTDNDGILHVDCIELLGDLFVVTLCLLHHGILLNHVVGTHVSVEVGAGVFGKIQVVPQMVLKVVRRAAPHQDEANDEFTHETHVDPRISI